ncbi:MSMEG_1061 family FMN-dependent PPOX-type flavoprotein [Roseomonas sp. AR75]|uniref:MSMEG_1061 family FMN-dependent PPOX-type flavoprotein n=1 Tax=Roseomonas sp. AR75 TaxID=2562311 RepID=UPI0010C090C4|nr:MSMEG_1061 family FMN-dependent PPOX-type flavoprotein [Roseomonas sp. AR75]
MDAPVEDPFAVTTPDALEALYDAPSLQVRSKVGTRIGPATRAFIAASPYCLLATIGTEGLHVTPRGDAPGFVVVADDHTLILPDRRGNNRLDALRDILRDPRVSLLLLVPGMTETLRVHGRARITTDPALRAAHAAQGKEPATLLVIAVESLFMQCGKAAIRSRLWEGRSRAPGVPTLGALIAEHSAGASDAAVVDAGIPESYRTRLY